MKESKKSTLSLQGNIVQIVQVLFVLVAIGLNIFGLTYIVGIFNSINQTETASAKTINSQLVPAFNQTLYNQITKQRSSLSTYASNSKAPAYTFPEIFGRF
jgi:hypothetical protein